MRIYLIGAYQPRGSKPGAVKIGVARDVNKRLEGIQTGNHLECRIIATWVIESTRKALSLERHAHKVFRDTHLCGEWFKPLVSRYVNFFNTRLAEDREHAIKSADRFFSDEADRKTLAQNPWLMEA